MIVRIVYFFIISRYMYIDFYFTGLICRRKIENPARKMLYPYTWGAKLAQFPYRWFWHNARIVRQMVWLSPFIGYGFYKIQSICK